MFNLLRIKFENFFNFFWKKQEENKIKINVKRNKDTNITTINNEYQISIMKETFSDKDLKNKLENLSLSCIGNGAPIKIRDMIVEAILESSFQNKSKEQIENRVEDIIKIAVVKEIKNKSVKEKIIEFLLNSIKNGEDWKEKQIQILYNAFLEMKETDTKLDEYKFIRILNKYEFIDKKTFDLLLSYASLKHASYQMSQQNYISIKKIRKSDEDVLKSIKNLFYPEIKIEEGILFNLKTLDMINNLNIQISVKYITHFDNDINGNFFNHSANGDFLFWIDLLLKTDDINSNRICSFFNDLIEKRYIIIKKRK